MEQICLKQLFYFMSRMYRNVYKLVGFKHSMAPPKGYKHSEEIRRKISESHKGKPSGMLGKHHSEEAKNKLRKASTGFRHSQETKNKIGKFHKGKILSEETREKISKAKTGKKRPPFTDETRKKMSEFQRKLWNENQKSKSKKYKQVLINGKLKRVSHIVWEKHYGKILEGCIIHHIDLNPENNKIENLLMLTIKDHIRLHRRLKKESKNA